ncbi:ankyrin repeat domain-containing protein [Limnohabitans sp. 2KL-27]|uniref:ankyrin repeat domain-containing protein n=1 Tax=Limnohabitans sp. 2KL-27 TaxID=1100705 RepID=UPI000ACFDA68
MLNINLFKKILVFIGFSTSVLGVHAGSYEDFFKAVQFDDVKSVQSLLQRGFDPNTVNPAGVPALMLAVREPSLKVAQLLAQWPKIKVEVRNDKDESPLMLAALKGYLPLVKTLVERDADVNKPGWTPLHYAASTGQVPVIEYLLDQSAYLDAESPNGTTPLMMAAMYGSPEAVKVLIQAGADLTLKNQLGLSALDFAVRGDRANAKALIETGLQRLQQRTPVRDASSFAAPVEASGRSADATSNAAVPRVSASPVPSSSSESVTPTPSHPLKGRW